MNLDDKIKWGKIHLQARRHTELLLHIQLFFIHFRNALNTLTIKIGN